MGVDTATAAISSSVPPSTHLKHSESESRGYWEVVVLLSDIPTPTTKLHLNPSKVL